MLETLIKALILNWCNKLKINTNTKFRAFSCYESSGSTTKINHNHGYGNSRAYSSLLSSFFVRTTSHGANKARKRRHNVCLFPLLFVAAQDCLSNTLYSVKEKLNERWTILFLRLTRPEHETLNCWRSKQHNTRLMKCYEIRKNMSFASLLHHPLPHSFCGFKANKTS